MEPVDVLTRIHRVGKCYIQTTLDYIQWNPEMQTLAGPTSSVLIIEVSFIQGLELLIITMSILYNIMMASVSYKHQRQQSSIAIIKNTLVFGHVKNCQSFSSIFVQKGKVEVTGAVVNCGTGYGMKVPCLYGTRAYVEQVQKIIRENNLS